jgi:predicted component of type VI protein secretion system
LTLKAACLNNRFQETFAPLCIVYCHNRLLTMYYTEWCKSDLTVEATCLNNRFQVTFAPLCIVYCHYRLLTMFYTEWCRSHLTVEAVFKQQLSSDVCATLYSLLSLKITDNVLYRVVQKSLDSRDNIFNL